MNLVDHVAGVVDGRRAQLGELPAELIYADDALDQTLPRLAALAPHRRVTLLYDANTRAAFGQAAEDALRADGWHVDARCVPPAPRRRSPVCDASTKDALAASCADSDIVLAVGSGVMNDLAKWLAFERDRPCAVLATAASMNGYAAANVATRVNGLKGLMRARAPRLIAAVPQVLADAPPAMTAAGVGDLVAKPVSTTDWRINHWLFDEPFSEDLAAMLDSAETEVTGAAERIAAREHDALGRLLEALVLGGCAMTLQGSSAPASGGEHLMSHTLDMKADLEDREHDLHGRQVGIATVFAAALYGRMATLEAPALDPARMPFDTSYWGSLAPVVAAQYEQARTAAEAATVRLGRDDNWSTCRALIARTAATPAAIRETLVRAGAAVTLDDIGVSRDDFRAAVLNSGAMRARFTSIDLAFLTGVLPVACNDIIDTWLQ